MRHLRIARLRPITPATVIALCCAASGTIRAEGAGHDTCSSAAESAERSAFVFRDAGESTGLSDLAAGIRGHGAAWGDVDGDGFLDLFIGTFHGDGAQPNLLLRSDRGRFRLDDQKVLRVAARATGCLLADLDNDGDLDLYVASMPAGPGSRLAARTGQVLVGCGLFRNQGAGRFVDVSRGNGACPEAFGGRGASVLDFDGDGLLDLLVGEDPVPGYNGSATKSSRLFRNRGDMQFEDVSEGVGLPPGIPGLGVASADFNGDGWPDFFLASSGGGNVMFLNDGRGRFREAPDSRRVFAWPESGGDDMVCGIACGDVNRDGLVDLVIGNHFERPWISPVANRLYLNRGVDGGNPLFEDVTERAGLKPLPMKAPHVEIQDFDNDAWPDVAMSVVKFANDAPFPLIFRNLGLDDGVPRFREDALAVNDFPTPDDRRVQRPRDFFAKMITDRKVIYMAAGPSADYDNDGRLDLFLPSWWTESNSLLLHNETPGGNWLQVVLEGSGGINRMGIGSMVQVYQAGGLGRSEALIASKEMSVGYGYASGQPAIVHIGLGPERAVDVRVILPHGKGSVTRRSVTANQRISVALNAQAPRRGESQPEFPPRLPGGESMVSDRSQAFLEPAGTLRPGVAIARTPPTVDFMYFPGQTYPGNPWSSWGDSLAIGGKYFASIGDHLAPSGDALVYEYDPADRSMRRLVSVRELVDLPDGHYTPGKIHGRLDLGDDGWLYFSTHRGSSRVTNDRYHYRGDWIIRCRPGSGQAEIVAQGVVPKHCVPASVLDPRRLIFYGGTAAGEGGEEDGIQFFAYDIARRKLLYAGADGPARALMFARSTGRAYYVPGKGDGPLMRYDPGGDSPVRLDGSTIGVRAATEETSQGMIYTVSLGQRSADADLWSFHAASERIENLGPAAVGSQAYIASLDVDPTGRYLYYVPGAHGGSEADGSAIVQFDTLTRRKKVIAFLHDFYRQKYGCSLRGTYSSAIDPSGDKLYVTWNVSRGGRAWDSCALTVVHIPESER